MKNKVIGFFDPANLTAVSTGVGALGSVAGMMKPDQGGVNFERQKQLQSQQNANNSVENARDRQQREQQTQQAMALAGDQKRAEALDRIIQQFQSTLKV